MILSSLEDTEKIAEIIGQSAQPGDVLVLTGELGAGKTTLTKGIALGLGIQQMIKSPTYTIIREYDQGWMPLYHMDVYRIGDAGGDLGLDEYFEGDGLSVVEWGNLLEESIPEDYLELILEKDNFDENRRLLTFRPCGERSNAFLNRILEHCELL